MATLPANRAEAAKLGYQYIGTLQGKDEAIRTYGSSRVKNIGGNYYVIPKGLTTPTPTTPIPVSKMTPYDELSKILGRKVAPNTVSSDIAGLLALQGSATPESQAYDQLTGKLTSLQGQLSGQATDLQNELNTQGVTQAYQQVKELTLKAAQLQGELGKFDAETTAQVSNLENQPISTGIISGQQAQLQKQRDLTRIGKASELSATIALNQAYQGNATLGSQLAQQAVDMKYQPILNEIETTRSQISIAGDKMSREDSKRAKIIDQLLNIKQQAVEDERANKKQVQAIAIELAGSGAPTSVVNQVRNANNPVDAARIAGQWTKANTPVAGGGGGRTTTTDANGNPVVKLSPAQATEVAEGNTLIDLANQALTLGEKTKWNGVGGFWKGSASDFLSKTFGAGSDDARSLRNLVGNIKATIAKARGGTSFTANEEKLLNSYTPNINESSKNIKNKLNNLISFIKTKNANISSSAAGTQSTASTGDLNSYLKSLGL